MRYHDALHALDDIKLFCSEHAANLATALVVHEQLTHGNKALSVHHTHEHDDDWRIVLVWETGGSVNYSVILGITEDCRLDLQTGRYHERFKAYSPEIIAKDISLHDVLRALAESEQNHG